MATSLYILFNSRSHRRGDTCDRLDCIGFQASPAGLRTLPGICLNNKLLIYPRISDRCANSINMIKETSQEDWHLLSAGKPEPDGSIDAEAHIAADSPWFSGHFPNEPVLPGIALLAMVSDTIRRRQAEAGKKVKISKIRKVRFRLPVRPASDLSLKLSCSERDNILNYQFRITLNGEMVCTGLMEAEPF